MAQGAPEITLVIATYNRADIIRRTLEHVARQTLPAHKFEVIICDDGSTDNTEEVVHSMARELPFRINYLKHPNRGPGFTQNRGIVAAASPIVCLIADDILLSPQALETFLEAHRARPEPNVTILGKVVQSEELRTKSVFLSKWDPFKFRFLEDKLELAYFLFWACNVSFKKDFMVRYGMFRTEMGPGGAPNHEDVEVGYRLYRNGMRLYYCREALGYHFHTETLSGACQRAYQRGLNWHGFRALVADPSVSVRYHVLTKSTWNDHLNFFFGTGRRVKIDTNPVSLFAKHAARLIFFNGVTVPYFWLPIMDAAEKNEYLARFMHTQLYRAVIYYYFLVGVKDEENRTTSDPGRAD